MNTETKHPLSGLGILVLLALAGGCPSEDKGAQGASGGTGAGDGGKTDNPWQQAPREDAGFSSEACGTRGGVLCGKDEFCNTEPDSDCGATDRGGQCQSIPDVCNKDFRPVCGCDGNTYGNTCTAHASGVSVRHAGECEALDGGMPNPKMWFETCGTPVCREEDTTGLPLCTWQVLGELCPEGAQECSTGSCNVRLQCTDADPTVNGCPRSRASYKENIEYLSDAELDRYHDEVMSLPLAHYAYQADKAHEPRLGFIIDDLGPATYVEESRDRVDLYAYTSAVIAAVKVQEKHIKALQSEVKALRKQLAKTRAQR